MTHQQDNNGAGDPGTMRPGTLPPEQMDETAAAAELAGLAAAIAFHDMRYHGEDDPVISDADYDALVARNRALEGISRISPPASAGSCRWARMTSLPSPPSRRSTGCRCRCAMRPAGWYRRRRAATGPRARM